MRIMILGHCGYVGDLFARVFASFGYEVHGLDIEWFGSPHISPNSIPYLTKDIRNIRRDDLKGYDIVIHLANIANDPAALLDPSFTWDVNAIGTKRVVDAMDRSQYLIYFSSGSVYGISNKDEVDEKTELYPLSEYNKTKMVAEEIIKSGKPTYTILRPATIDGFSRNQRLDLMINAMIWSAMTKGKVIVNGGAQQRPTVNILDIQRLVLSLIQHPAFNRIYNVNSDVISAEDAGRLVGEELKVPVEVVGNYDSADSRSYRMSSDFLKRDRNFQFVSPIRTSIQATADSFRQRRKFIENLGSRPWRVKWMELNRERITDG